MLQSLKFKILLLRIHSTHLAKYRDIYRRMCVINFAQNSSKTTVKTAWILKKAKKTTC